MTARKDQSRPSRRRVLQTAGGVFAAAAMPMRANTAVAPQAAQPRANADVTGRLARYMVSARDRALPPDALRESRHRVLDTIAAMVSGARLKPGEMAIKYVRTLGGTPEASVLTTDFRTSAVNAALINGMLAHSDETDDFEPVTKAHPGCSVVPAALALAEREGRSGQEFLRAVALGYDVCCRFLLALGADHVRGTHRSAEGTSATFGAVGAAASLARLDELCSRHPGARIASIVGRYYAMDRDQRWERIDAAYRLIVWLSRCLGRRQRMGAGIAANNAGRCGETKSPRRWRR